jgi:N-terminal domain of anti-restriction factor ArdC
MQTKTQTGAGSNEALKMQYLAQNPEIKTFKTFTEWKREGYSVLKGEKGFQFWSNPIKTTKEKPDGEAKESKFFKVVYLFADTQVKPIGKS